MFLSESYKPYLTSNKTAFFYQNRIHSSFYCRFFSFLAVIEYTLIQPFCVRHWFMKQKKNFTSHILPYI
jgi:hypothetical protein